MNCCFFCWIVFLLGLRCPGKTLSGHTPALHLHGFFPAISYRIAVQSTDWFLKSWFTSAHFQSPRAKGKGAPDMTWNLRQFPRELPALDCGACGAPVWHRCCCVQQRAHGHPYHHGHGPHLDAHTDRRQSGDGQARVPLQCLGQGRAVGREKSQSSVALFPTPSCARQVPIALIFLCARLGYDPMKLNVDKRRAKWWKMRIYYNLLGKLGCFLKIIGSPNAGLPQGGKQLLHAPCWLQVKLGAQVQCSICWRVFVSPFLRWQLHWSSSQNKWRQARVREVSNLIYRPHGQFCI